ncbi:MAG: ATP-dependent Clp protease proteolytic subunit, partial [Pseudomonadota bacterium]
MITPTQSRAYAERADGDDKDNEKDENARKNGPGPQIGQILFKQRTMLLVGEIDMKLAREFTAQLLALAAES